MAIFNPGRTLIQPGVEPDVEGALLEHLGAHGLVGRPAPLGFVGASVEQEDAVICDLKNVST